MKDNFSSMKVAMDKHSTLNASGERFGKGEWHNYFQRLISRFTTHEITVLDKWRLSFI